MPALEFFKGTTLYSADLFARVSTLKSKLLLLGIGDRREANGSEPRVLQGINAYTCLSKSQGNHTVIQTQCACNRHKTQ